ncbi:MAG: hypothetical protein KF774_18225 [Planctomyces sp.]|nr:hypothetical protein [Planctomyces sp.]
MRKYVVMAVAVLGAAATQVDADTVQTRVRERSLITQRNSVDSIVDSVIVQTSNTTLQSTTLPSFTLQPTPADGPTPALPIEVVEPAPLAYSPVYAGPALYTNVKVRGERKTHPCAVPVVVSAPDPCNPCCTVCVEVCVPPCAVADVRCRRNGQKVIYDFGKYEVSLTARKDFVLVSYSR